MNTLYSPALSVDTRHKPHSANSETIGNMIRQWRAARKLSQMELALEIDISPRHLSFVENGRSRPSVEVLMLLAEYLQVPLRTRNLWLLSAGYAPRYSEQPLDSGRMAHARSAIQRLLDTHEPFPGIALDRHWNVVLNNEAAAKLIGLLPDSLKHPEINIFKASLHPDGFAAYTKNFQEWGGYLLHTMQRLMLSHRDEKFMALIEEVNTWPNIRALRQHMQEQPSTPHSAEPSILVPCLLEVGGHSLSMFTTLTTFGSPRDITLHEICIELFYPADEPTRAFFSA